MNSALSSEADKKQAMDMGKGIYAFTLKNAAGDTDSWHIDLKNEGKVAKGVGEKPDGMRLLPKTMSHPKTTSAQLTMCHKQSPSPFRKPTSRALCLERAMRRGSSWQAS